MGKGTLDQDHLDLAHDANIPTGHAHHQPLGRVKTWELSHPVCVCVWGGASECVHVGLHQQGECKHLWAALSYFD